MSWDQPYSFGQPLGAQPPTPGQTPTNPHFPETPKYTTQLDNRSGWTPTFAEEYTVFASTPGRLTSATQGSFVEATPPQQPYGATPQERRYSRGRDLESQLASHVHILSDQGTPLLAVTSSQRLPSSPNPDLNGQGHFDAFAQSRLTPQARKRLEEPFRGQTATPPNTASKSTRKLAPKPSTESMQSDTQDPPFGASGTPTQSNVMSFTSTSGDVFGYPMSAPSTAPLFTNMRPFWDPDAGVNAMDIDFTATEDAGIFNQQNAHRISSSYDWGRSAHMFQDAVKFPSNANESVTTKHQRALAPKTPSCTEQPTTGPYSFVSTSVTSAAFTAPMNVLDPGLLYSRHNSIGSGLGDVTLPDSRPTTSHVTKEPYEHQIRESRRYQEDLHRSRSGREGMTSFNTRGTVSSPVRVSSSNLSDSRGRRSQARNGRSSPIKRHSTISMTSIPESHIMGIKTEMKLTVDANGRARTETIVVGPEERPTPLTGSRQGWDASPYESSTDDDEILLPSQNTSFALPSHSKVPKLRKYDTAHRRGSLRRRSIEGSGYSHSESSNSTRLDGAESEAETLVGQDDRSGDATHELRKVMQSRNRDRKQPRASNHHYHSESRGSYDRKYSTNNISPTTVSNLNGATPSNIRGGSTRCVCHSPESGGFMIQCESCDYWLHGQCCGIDRHSIPPVYICAFCANTPNARGARLREAPRGSTRAASSPLAHKSFKCFR